MRTLAALLLCTAIGFASDSVRPQCNSRNRGRFWPEEANRSGAAARQAARCGELQMCTIGLWRYGWQNLTVSYARLASTSNPAPAGCRASDAPARDAANSTAVEE